MKKKKRRSKLKQTRTTIMGHFTKGNTNKTTNVVITHICNELIRKKKMEMKKAHSTNHLIATHNGNFI